jgi:hypothetical protein
MLTYSAVSTILRPLLPLCFTYSTANCRTPCIDFLRLPCSHTLLPPHSLDSAFLFSCYVHIFHCRTLYSFFLFMLTNTAPPSTPCRVDLIFAMLISSLPLLVALCWLRIASLMWLSTCWCRLLTFSAPVPASSSCLSEIFVSFLLQASLCFDSALLPPTV